MIHIIIIYMMSEFPQSEKEKRNNFLISLNKWMVPTSSSDNIKSNIRIENRSIYSNKRKFDEYNYKKIEK